MSARRLSVLDLTTACEARDREVAEQHRLYHSRTRSSPDKTSADSPDCYLNHLRNISRSKLFEETDMSLPLKRSYSTAPGLDTLPVIDSVIDDAQPHSRRPSDVVSIDSSSLLAPSPASKASQLRPLQSLVRKPSWIGPPNMARRPSSPDAMKEVIVEYSSPGLKPPVYVFTNLSEPPWEAVEMSSKEVDDGFTFFKSFQASDGEYQYKFRLGPGDWWVCDSSKPTIDDGHGNKNNVLQVSNRQSADGQSSWGETTSVHEESAATPRLPISAPASPYEASHAHRRSSDRNNSEIRLRSIQLPSLSDALTNGNVPMPTPASGPLLRHETLAIDTWCKQEDEATLRSNTNGQDSDSNPSWSDANRGTSTRSDSPLFRHESLTLDSPSDLDSTPTKATSSSEEEIDLKDPSLEPFPTDERGILESIRKASLHIPSLEPLVHPSDPWSARTSAFSSTIPTPLPDLNEEEEDQRSASVNTNTSESTENVVVFDFFGRRKLPRVVADVLIHPICWVALGITAFAMAKGWFW